MKDIDTKKVLIVKQNGGTLFLKNNEIIQPYYKHNSGPLYYMRRFLNKNGIYLLDKYFYGEWKKQLNKYEIIILFDSEYNKQISKYIKKNNQKATIIFWYWNTIKSHNNKIIDDENIDEIWTYNRFDAKDYHIKYTSQFYTKIKQTNNEGPISTDIIFVGKNKSRESEIQNIINESEKQNISYNIKIVNNKKEMVDYDAYIDEVKKSKCILDISETVPCGISLRPLEAIFYNKKLITNNSDIVNYDFYNKNNIFIIGKDDINNLKSFIDSPINNISEKIKNRYTFDAWLNTIISKRNIK